MSSKRNKSAHRLQSPNRFQQVNLLQSRNNRASLLQVIILSNNVFAMSTVSSISLLPIWIRLLPSKLRRGLLVEMKFKEVLSSRDKQISNRWGFTLRVRLIARS